MIEQGFGLGGARSQLSWRARALDHPQHLSPRDAGFHVQMRAR